MNRILLALAGLALFVLGGGVLLGGLDLPRRWKFSMPTWWPFTGPQEVLLTAQERTRFRDHGWWWPVALTILTVLVLLLLWWVLAQLRRRHLREVLVNSGDGQAARLRGRTLGQAMAAEAEALEGTTRAHIRVTGRSTAPAVRVRVMLAAHANPADTLTVLTRHTLQHARDSMGLERLPATIRLKEARHQARRVG
ncbi:alkaline shock response membrane anchor protein AmaP [Streptomyces sp. H34-S4]|uniref:alkaline shock response membrane anchor protein AmaP n=1 Tax=Streptomyces sp. H34-S4 TaxID=2996463 RepID=UPI002D1E39DF|nr:alkaline shock response membrane anchor protein AmaP [Streptomyces sp. H34-S4]